jgi:hypothetical protein
MAGILQDKMAGYPLDMEAFWLGDKSRIRADNATSASRSFPMICSWVNRFLLISLSPFNLLL